MKRVFCVLVTVLATVLCQSVHAVDPNKPDPDLPICDIDAVVPGSGEVAENTETNPGGYVFANRDDASNLTTTVVLKPLENGNMPGEYRLTWSGGIALWRDAAGTDRVTTDTVFGSDQTTTLYVEFLQPGAGSITLNYSGKYRDKDGEAKDESASDNVAVCLVPFDIEGYKPGTINAPGAKLPKASGEFGQETVMMENADSESEENSTELDYTFEGNLTAYRMARDDDLVKVVLRWPKDMRISGVKLELKHKGLEVDPTKTTDATKYKETGPSRLNFYKPDGTKLTIADFKIDNLGSPGSSYLADILTTGESTMFVEGAKRFGYDGSVANNRKNLGGAILNFEVTYNNVTSRARLLVYRGGFFKYRQPTGSPGTLGTLEFWDGKGRVKHATGGKGNEFRTDEWDQGKILASWQARSGKMTDGSQGSPGLDYDVTEAKAGRLPCGHLPPGWWFIGPYREISASQDNKVLSNGVIKQGWYCRWLTDDGPNPYQTPYRYNPAIDSPAPTSIKFKFDLIAVGGTDDHGREGFQIHPDGEKDGTAGCVGLQAVQACKDVQKVLRSYHGLKLRCVRE